MISFEKFRVWYTKTYGKVVIKDIMSKTGLSRNTVDKIWNDGVVSTKIINTICSTYDIRVEDIMEYRKDGQ
ncbi:helix-turn-helix transcriptional regulator [Hazenella sp. IB182357]|uniref:Helix-turn-helix transcriptional regulator n=1 Tax=Polycladospora coralii TaxID=2771432 RepID=A0A926NIE5_9BACL|nr:helix-turn-helix transcriptional regulator [Polycladospora coralii]